LFVVVDVGAGTTDFAAFWADQNPAREIFTVWQIRGTVDALAQAGDTIDGYLQNRILEKAHLRPGTTDYSYAAAKLSQDIRPYKESLFLKGQLDVVLTNSTSVTIKRDEFLGDSAMLDFAKLLRDRFHGVLVRADRSWIDQVASLARVGRDYITVVLTGGGAGLPIVRDLCNQVVDIDGRKLMCKPATDVPLWLADRYPRLRDEYPRLAVALGGAARRLPELAPETAAFAAPGGAPKWIEQTIYRS
jgi:molecular chaperone HscA